MQAYALSHRQQSKGKLEIWEHCKKKPVKNKFLVSWQWTSLQHLGNSPTPLMHPFTTTWKAMWFQTAVHDECVKICAPRCLWGSKSIVASWIKIFPPTNWFSLANASFSRCANKRDLQPSSHGSQIHLDLPQFVSGIPINFTYIAKESFIHLLWLELMIGRRLGLGWKINC